MTFPHLEYIQQPGKSQTSLLCPASQWHCIWQTEPTDFTGTVLSLRPACLSLWWPFTKPMLGKLEKFQGDLGKKILNIPTHYSNLLAPSGCIKMARFQILQRELTFLWHTLHSTEITIYVSAFESLREKGCEPLLIQQCKFLESV